MSQVLEDCENEGSPKKKVIFVNSTARCGSTLLDLILGNDPRGFSLGEVCSWYRPTRTHHFDIKCGCGVYPCPVWDQLRDVRETELYDRVLALPDVSFVVDSSKQLTWVIDQNLQLTKSRRYEVVNIFLYKDPVSLHHSLWKRGERQIAHVLGAYQYYRRAIAARIPFVSVNYDWLIDDISNRLPLVCDIVGIDSFPSKERFWESTHHHLFGSFGTRRQLFSSRPSINREQFHPEYMAEVDSIKEAFARDDELQAILRELQRRDVRDLSHGALEDVDRVRRPSFYYGQRLREWRQRFFPESYLDREAATIREWRV